MKQEFLASKRFLSMSIVKRIQFSLLKRRKKRKGKKKVVKKY